MFSLIRNRRMVFPSSYVILAPSPSTCGSSSCSLSSPPFVVVSALGVRHASECGAYFVVLLTCVFLND